MGKSQIFILRAPPHPSRERCKLAINSAPDGYTVEIREPKRTDDQNAKFHAMIDDVAEQMEFCGRKWDRESMKRIITDQFRRDTAKDPDLADLWGKMGTVEMAPSLDGTGLVALGWQTRRFPKKLMIAAIDWLYALGSEQNVVWSETVTREIPHTKEETQWT